MSRELTKHKKHPTMKEVAAAAGVSTTTVSFVINEVNGANISMETKARVMAAVERLNYRPNAAAAVLRTNRSHSLGFVTDFIASTPYAGEIIHGAQNAAWGFDQLLTIINTDGDRHVEEAAIAMLLERRVDGVIYASLRHQARGVPELLRETTTVLLNCFAIDGSFPSVVPDEYSGGYRATSALLDAGHRRIAFLNMDLDPNHPPAEGRLLGYRTALADYGVDYDPALVAEGDSRTESGYRTTLAVMNLVVRPTALFCGTDRMAMGAYYALDELGLVVPTDISVVGFDDQHLISANIRPALSTMALPFYEMGLWAVNHLNALQAGANQPIQHKATCTFVPRESIAARAN